MKRLLLFTIIAIVCSNVGKSYDTTTHLQDSEIVYAYLNMVEDGQHFSNVKFELSVDLRDNRDVYIMQEAVYLPDNVVMKIDSNTGRYLTLNPDINNANLVFFDGVLYTVRYVLALTYPKETDDCFLPGKYPLGTFTLDCSNLAEGEYFIKILEGPSNTVFMARDNGEGKYYQTPIDYVMKFRVKDEKVYEVPYPQYDINQDWVVNAGDVSLEYKYIFKLNSLGDLNGDGEVNVGDISSLYNVILRQ